jgi:hypothetical protein
VVVRPAAVDLCSTHLEQIKHEPDRSVREATLCTDQSVISLVE